MGTPAAFQIVTKTVTLYRRDNSGHEVREVWIYRFNNVYELWESIQFLSDEHYMKRGKLCLGSESEIEKRWMERIEQLKLDGFVLCQRGDLDE
jgi:hypothetical protein